MEKKEFISFERAVEKLSDKEFIHTFRSVGPISLGANIDRVGLIETMKEFQDTLEIAGENARLMGHGLVLTDDKGPLFIEA